MGQFKNWYDNPILFLRKSKDGIFAFAINGKRYTYTTYDDAPHAELMGLIKKGDPNALIGRLNKLVGKGHAQQIDPPQSLSPPQQLTLF